MKKPLAALVIFTLSFSCNNQKNEPIVVTPEEYHASEDKVTGIMFEPGIRIFTIVLKTTIQVNTA